MEILDFFQPVDLSRFDDPEKYPEESFFHHIYYFEGSRELPDDRKIALIGITDSRNGDSTDEADNIRRYLYRLCRSDYARHVIDMGNFSVAYDEKSFESLGFALSELISHNLTPIILNGRQSLTYAQYLSFAYLRQYVNLVLFDSAIDFDLQEHKRMNENNYLQNMLTIEPNYLFNMSILGFQGYFVDQNIQEFLSKLNFDLVRLGEMRTHPQDTEPLLRSAHLISWDLGAIRHSDAAGTLHPGPNGLYGEEACQFCRYAGLGSNVRSAGFYNYDLSADDSGQTAHLVAQMIWYFLDGYLNRYPENPGESMDDFFKYITNHHNKDYQIIFYKSKRTDRWWMEVPVIDHETAEQVKFYMPCSYLDYQQASQDIVPDRWLMAVRKLS